MNKDNGRMKEIINKIKFWWEVIVKREWDFEIRCVFPEQIKYKNAKYGNGETVEVPMKSGKTALFKAIADGYSRYGGTGQQDWHFEFIRLVQ